MTSEISSLSSSSRPVLCLVLFLLASLASTIQAWSTLPSSSIIRSLGRTSTSMLSVRENINGDNEETNVDFLKAELVKYLEKRTELDADNIARQEVGKKLGGTRGNALLDYVSLAPNKGSTVEAAPNIFDYSELQRYGFSHLATPIMKAGGRLAMYDLMGLERPAISSRPSPRYTAEPIIIDRTGQNDAARYTGLKLGQVIDDNLQAQVLAEAERKVKQGEALRPKLMEEEYERPFADVTRASSYSNPNPYWTVERLDEWGKMRGKVIADAKRAEAETLVADRMESLELELSQRLYSILTGLLAAVAFGKSTPTFLLQVLGLSSGELEILDSLKAPAAVLLIASLGSSVYCAIQSSEKQRNGFVWMIKGLLGGPLSIQQLKDLPSLETRRELEERQRESSSS